MRLAGELDCGLRTGDKQRKGGEPKTFLTPLFLTRPSLDVCRIVRERLWVIWLPLFSVKRTEDSRVLFCAPSMNFASTEKVIPLLCSKNRTCDVR